MRENVGRWDRGLRAIAGPTLAVLGYALWGGDRGRIGGLVALVSGALIAETAITKVCPLNALFGINTARSRAISPRLEQRADEIGVSTAAPEMENVAL